MRVALSLLLIIVLMSHLAVAEKSPAPLRVATYNLRMNTPNDGADAWPNRKELVKNLVRYYDFDVFGTQEGFQGQLTDIAELPPSRPLCSSPPWLQRRPPGSCSALLQQVIRLFVHLWHFMRSSLDGYAMRTAVTCERTHPHRVNGDVCNRYELCG